MLCATVFFKKAYISPCVLILMVMPMPKLVVVGRARGNPPQPVSIWDIFEARNNPKRRITTSPFGLTPEQLEAGVKVYYPSKAVPWKGKKGAKDFPKAAEGHGALLHALGLARKISVLYKGVTGTTIDPKTGRIVPKKGVKQRNWREEHPELVDYYNREIRPRAKKFKRKAYIDFGLPAEIELGARAPAPE